MSMVNKTNLIVGLGLTGALALGASASAQRAITPQAAVPVAAEPATASDHPHPESFSVEYEVAAPPATVLAPSCNSASQCALPYTTGTGQLTGDVIGSGIGAGSAVIGTDYASSVANAIVTATIAPCGSGTFVTRYFVVYDLHDVAAGKPGTWEVVEGLGTGDLASLTGDGTFTIVQSNPDLSSISAWEGKLNCRPPAPANTPGSAANNER
jgi:Protein of unknown function (DUF3224)